MTAKPAKPILDIPTAASAIIAPPPLPSFLPSSSQHPQPNPNSKPHTPNTNRQALLAVPSLNNALQAHRIANNGTRNRAKILHAKSHRQNRRLSNPETSKLLL
jgi:hypothetical protein